jgi:hypothetical protein
MMKRGLTAYVMSLLFVTLSVGCGDDGETGGIIEPENSPPEVAITAPQDGAMYEERELIAFAAVASDREDGLLSGANLVWSSNKDDDAFGTGTTVEWAGLSAGTH